MKSNYIATLYFIVGFLTSFSLMVQGEQLYVNLAGLTLFLYLLFSLTEALEDLGLLNYNFIYYFTQLKIPH